MVCESPLSPTLSPPATSTRSHAPEATWACPTATDDSPVAPPVLMRMKRLLRAPTASTPSRSALPMPSSASGASEYTTASMSASSRFASCERERHPLAHELGIVGVVAPRLELRLADADDADAGPLS